MNPKYTKKVCAGDVTPYSEIQIFTKYFGDARLIASTTDATIRGPCPNGDPRQRCLMGCRTNGSLFTAHHALPIPDRQNSPQRHVQLRSSIQSSMGNTILDYGKNRIHNGLAEHNCSNSRPTLHTSIQTKRSRRTRDRRRRRNTQTRDRAR